MANLSASLAYAQKNLPAGVIIPYGGGAVPDGFLACDGAAVSRSIFATLFSVIGVTYGAGDSSTTFNTPDMRGIFPRGVGSQTISAVSYDGSTLGTKRKDRTNSTGLTASTSSTNSCAVGDYNAAHTHTWSDRYFNEPLIPYTSYSEQLFEAYVFNYSNVETARTTGNPNVSLNHTHTLATNTVSSSSSFNNQDVNTVPGYLTVAYLIKV